MAMEPRTEAGDVVAVPATPPRITSTENLRSPSLSTKDRYSRSTTPPPSTQVVHNKRSDDAIAGLLLTPTTSRMNASKDLPSKSHIDQAGIDDLRTMVKSLVTDLTDARIAAANARLQHHLLLLETNQAAERAEVENQLSRCEVDLLRVKHGKPDLKALYSTSSAVQPPATARDMLSQTMRSMESHCETLEELCDQLRREKDSQAERIQSLSEHNTLLVNRIRENREHLTRIRGKSPPSLTPRETYTTPRRKGYSRYQDNTPAHGPFAALIAADQILSQETASGSSTPSKSHAARVRHGHTRGAHSLSSITALHNKDRPTTSDSFLGSQFLLSAPASQLVTQSAERERHDRDSTISISDTDYNLEQHGLTQSQASSLAADMLRKNPSTFEALRGSQDAEKTSSLLQSKIFGNVKKPGHDGSPANLKRAYGLDGHIKSKKVRTGDRIGLGIEA